MRKMGFIVDKVSEDSFYENLLLGLPRVLEKSPFISNLNLVRLTGVKQTDIRQWEHNNSTNLPEDLRAFYSSTNGFLYTYDFTYDYTTPDENARMKRQGKIEINSLNEVVRIYGYETKSTASIEAYGKKYKLSLSRESKVFELHMVDQNAKVVLVYLNNYSMPTIWLYSASMAFNYLAEDFTVYFRMCIAHLGIPCWQYIVTKEGLPEWSKEIFQLIAPGVLHEDRNLIDIPKYNNCNFNRLDSSIFLAQPNFVPKEKPVIQQITQQTTKEQKDKKKAVGRRHISFRTGRGVVDSRK